MRRTTLLTTAAALAIVFALGACASGKDANWYVIYVHGKAVEDGGRRPVTRYGTYEYDAILEAFRTAGFHVISEQRGKAADSSAAADGVVRTVRELEGRGVPPSQIAVVGASKGAVITMLASTRLQHPDVRYVLLGNCNDSIFQRNPTKLSGHVLSIYEKSDEFGGTCQKFFERAGALRNHDEIALDLGIGHSFLYTPRKEWLQPAISWARHGRRQSARAGAR